MTWIWCCRWWIGSHASPTDSSWRRARPRRSHGTPRSRTSILDAAMLEVTDLHSYYGEAHVVQGATLNCDASEVVALLGRNGMGKTSLIRSIMGLKAPQVRGGDVRWKGVSLKSLAPHQIAARKIGYVPQGR